MRRVPSGTWERRVWASDKYGERSTVGEVAVVRPGPGALPVQVALTTLSTVSHEVTCLTTHKSTYGASAKREAEPPVSGTRKARARSRHAAPGSAWSNSKRDGIPRGWVSTTLC